MSTRASFFHEPFAATAVRVPEKTEPKTAAVPGRPAWDVGRFAEEQIRRLVRQIFFPGWPRPAHHVAFAAVDESTDAGAICMTVGEILSVQAPGNICVVEANPHADTFTGADEVSMSTPDGARFDVASSRTQRLSSRLWHMPHGVFCEGGSSPDLRKRPGSCGTEASMGRLRAEFDYTAIHVPPAGLYNDAVLLGQLSDGVVLIVEANSTRRAAAQRAKEILQAANVRLLGTVLNGRTFPIPHAIYNRL